MEEHIKVRDNTTKRRAREEREGRRAAPNTDTQNHGPEERGKAMHEAAHRAVTGNGGTGLPEYHTKA